MLEENRAVVHGISEAFNKGTLDELDELVAPDFVGHNPLMPEPIRGLEGLKGFFAAVRAAMPDIHHPSVTLIAEGDLVVIHAQNEGTFTNEFIPTGKKVSYWMANIWRIAEGKAVECWFNFDTLGLMQQLGVVPPLG